MSLILLGIVVFGVVAVVAVYLLIVGIALKTVHYAESHYTHCGQFIHAVNGRIIQHTTIVENVTCGSCRAKLRKKKYAGT